MGKFTLEASLQTGYMNSLSLVDRIVLNDEGQYEASKGWGKSQFIFGAGTSIGFMPKTTGRLKRIFIAYDIRMQLPFVKSYVTILPNGALSLGCQFTINQ